MIENEICIKFHYDQDQSTRAIRTFIKPPMADRGDRLVFDPAMTHGYNVNSQCCKIIDKKRYVI